MQAKAEIGVRAIAALCLLSFAAPLAAQEAVECELLPSPSRMLPAEISKEYLVWLRLTCSGTLAAWPDETRTALSLRFSAPLHRVSRPLLRMRGAPPGAARKGFVRGGVVTWSGVRFPPRRAGSQPAVVSVTGLAVNAAQSPPEVAVVVGVSSGQATMTLAVAEAAVARVLP